MTVMDDDPRLRAIVHAYAINQLSEARLKMLLDDSRQWSRNLLAEAHRQGFDYGQLGKALHMSKSRVAQLVNEATGVPPASRG